MVARTGENMKNKTTHEEELADNRVEIGSGSVYADLGLKNHEEMETKSNLVMEISKVIKKKN